MKIGESIKEIRKTQKLKLKDLSEKTGITVSFLSDIENDKKKPSIDTLRKIADALDIPVHTFFHDAGRPTAVPSGSSPSQGDFLKQAATLFMSGELTNEDKEAVFKDLTDLYWKCKGYQK